MAKKTMFKLKVTLKAGTQVFLKDSVFNEENLPDALRDEVKADSQFIEVVSFGDDFESASFDSKKSISLKEPKKKIVSRQKGK